MNTFLAILPYLLVIGGLIGSGIYAWRKCKREPQYVEVVCYRNNSFLISEGVLEFLDELENGPKNLLFEEPTHKYKNQVKMELYKLALDTPESNKKTFYMTTVTRQDGKLLVNARKLDGPHNIPKNIREDWTV
jgi:hypothetical protein